MVIFEFNDMLEEYPDLDDFYEKESFEDDDDSCEIIDYYDLYMLNKNDFK